MQVRRRGDEVIVGDLTIQEIQRIMGRCRELSGYHQVAADRIECHHSHDYDGYPFEQWRTLGKRKEGDHPTNPYEWNIHFTYHSTSGDEFDFIEMAGRSRATAHKYVRPDPATETRFMLVGVHVSKSDDLIEEVARLQAVYRTLDAQTQSLEAWVSASLDMMVHCSACRSIPSVIRTENLRGYLAKGASLEHLSAKLSCERCGEHDPKLTPLPSGGKPPGFSRLLPNQAAIGR